MDWKTDSNLHESEVEPYSSFQSNKSGKLIDRMEIPIILIGAGLLVLVVLFVLFIPKKSKISLEDYKHIVTRLDELEQKIEDQVGSDISIREFDPSKNPLEYQQLINWIKSNAEVISETIKKVDDIENELKTAQKTKPVVAVKPRAEKPVQQKQKTTAVTKSPEKPKPVTKAKPSEKSKPVQIKPQKKSKPEIQAKPIVETPKPVVQSQPVVEAKPITKKPETVKLIFHRVEKGETLYRISRKYGISVEKLQELNDMKKEDLIINIGQELIVSAEKQ
ncbi:MAG: LysM peptidoglycan-binding domain-containing protein [Desulfobacteraceae bacterium]|nr:LysM peptidoglycan-binding domain-containing protein [Desulfobacteraceae bacterium]MBC2756486.1 LysM peptidoglycan-binding domain-containing protein [Desulfobacteraceae bacterium]